MSLPWRKVPSPRTARALPRGARTTPATVLPRLSDDAYDLALLQTAGAATPELLDHARRLLRVGGVLLVRGALRPGDHADALARFLHNLAEDATFAATVLPLDQGLVLATRLADTDDPTGTSASG